MLTLFTIPKAFRGHINVIQRNALRSWTLLRPPVDVILFGTDEGVAEAAREFGVRHCPEVARTPFGTPLLDSVFAQAVRLSPHHHVCYVNADIMLLDDLVQSLARIPFPRFLLVGRRWDVDLVDPWDFDDPQWQDKLRAHVRRTGVPHPPMGSDYFLFPPDRRVEHLPPFAVGRPGWDCWMIRHGRRLGIPVIDGSGSVFAIHQNHDYSHVPQGNGQDYFGPEAEHNARLMNERVGNYDLLDCNYLLTSGGVRRALTRAHLHRRCVRIAWIRGLMHAVNFLRLMRRHVLHSLRKMTGSQKALAAPLYPSTPPSENRISPTAT